MGGSSGGSSGKVEYPEYMETAHGTWLGLVDDGLVATSSSNPYTSLSAPSISVFDSETVLDTFAERLTNREAAINELIPADILASGGVGFLPTSDVIYDLYLFAKAWWDDLKAFIPTAIEIDPSLGGALSNLQGRLNDLDAWTETDIAGNLTQLDNRITELHAIDDLEGAVDLVTVVYPRFEAGMRDINAVQSSSFTVGRAVMEATYQAKMQDIKHGLINQVEQVRANSAIARSQVRAQIEELKNAIEIARAQLSEAESRLELEADKSNADIAHRYLQLAHSALQVAGNLAIEHDNYELKIATVSISTNVDWAKYKQNLLIQMDGLRDALVSKTIEFRRIKVVAAFEQTAMDADFDHKEKRWDWESYQYASNVMASISGGTASSMPGTSKFASALGGGLSGAATGAQIGGAVSSSSSAGGWGALVGGIVGAGSAMMQ